MLVTVMDSEALSSFSKFPYSQSERITTLHRVTLKYSMTQKICKVLFENIETIRNSFLKQNFSGVLQDVELRQERP